MKMKTPEHVTLWEPEDGEALYRFEEAIYSPGVDDFDDPLPGYTMEVHLHKFPIERRTPKGVWIRGWGGMRFVLLSARKRYACPTIEEALESFQARKNRQIKILKGQLQRAELALSLSDSWKEKPNISYTYYGR